MTNSEKGAIIKPQIKERNERLMTEKNMYYVAEEKLLDEIAREKKFSFRAILKLLTASSISRKF